MPPSPLVLLATVSLAPRSDGDDQPDRSGSNFKNEVIVTAVVLMVCSFFAVTARIKRTWHVMHGLDIPSILLILAFISAIITSVGSIILTTRGLGVHDHLGVISRKPGFQKPLIMTNCFYFTCNFFVKLALLSMYKKFTMEWWGVWLIRLMVFLSFAFCLGEIFSTTLECIPLAFVWGGTTSGSCINFRSFYIANSSIMIGLDTILYLMPIVFTWGMTLSPSQIIGLRVLFGLGFIVIASSCARLYVVCTSMSTNDVAYTWGRVYFASLIENHLAIIIACAPAIKTIFLNNVVLKVKTFIRSNLSRIPLIWKRAPESETAGECNSPGTLASPSPASTKFRTKWSDIFSISTLKSNETTSTTVRGVEERIDLSFHEQRGDFIKEKTTTATGFPNLEEAQTSNSIVSVSQNINVTEGCVTPPNIVVSAAVNEKDGDRIEEHNSEQRARNVVFSSG